MFSGIVEISVPLLTAELRGTVLQVHVERPKTFEDLHIGDSIAVDGLCLTLEAFNEVQMTFALGPETLRVTGWSRESVLDRAVHGRNVNVERSLRLSDRIHGHLVTGHVDCVGLVVESTRQGETLQLTIEYPNTFRAFIWSKGSLAINGVSLTINQTEANHFSVGLIPETLKRTNLGNLKVGDRVNLEIDNTARGIVRWAQVKEQESSK